MDAAHRGPSGKPPENRDAGFVRSFFVCARKATQTQTTSVGSVGSERNQVKLEIR
jgi:hypothetical protein